MNIKQTMRYWIPGWVLAILFLVSLACGQSATPIPIDVSSIQTAVVETQTAIANVPANTLLPSATLIPTATNAPLSTTTFTLAPTNSTPPTPTTTSAFTVLVLTSPVRVGENTTVQIQTVAGASCFLSYTTPSGTDSQATGLGATTASANGVCSWTWNIGLKTNTGTGSLAITANGVTQMFNIVIQ